MKEISFTTGTVKIVKGETRGTLTLLLKDDCRGAGFIGYKQAFLEDIFAKILSNLEIGAWRVKPNYAYSGGDYQIRCRFFPGKPEEYQEAKDA